RIVPHLHTHADGAMGRGPTFVGRDEPGGPGIVPAGNPAPTISFLLCSNICVRNYFMASALRKFTPVRPPEAVDDFVVGARVDADRRNGRGAESNRSGRFEPI